MRWPAERAALSGQRLTVFYDRDCALCRAAMQRWRRADVRGQLRFIAAQQAVRRSPVVRRAMLARIHALAGGRCYRGASAVREVYRRLPGSRPLLWLIAVGIRCGLAEPFYAFVASRRHLLPIGRCEGPRCRREDLRRPHP